jgi:hypothetical protein
MEVVNLTRNISVLLDKNFTNYSSIWNLSRRSNQMETQEPSRGEIIDALGCYAGHVFLLEILNNSTEQHAELNFVDLSVCSKY